VLFWAGSTLSLAGEFVQESGTNVTGQESNALCRFVDPTNDVTGLSRYRKALTILFDPARSEVKLKQIWVSGPATVEADWTLGGILKLPWQPRIQTISGHTVSMSFCCGLTQTVHHHSSASSLQTTPYAQWKL